MNRLAVYPNPLRALGQFSVFLRWASTTVHKQIVLLLRASSRLLFVETQRLDSADCYQCHQTHSDQKIPWATVLLPRSMNDGPLGRRVLSIQSHVVHGYVGNKCCVFPLQLMGFEVDHICSVQFSNHTGYKKWRGTVTTADQLWELIEGLQSNDLLNYTHLVTGYIGSVGLLKVIKRVVDTLRRANPDLIYVCDPVLGDDGKLYLPSEMVGLYKSDLLHLASVITPNQFEAEQLAGLNVQTEQEALQACHYLLDQGPKTVVLTSFIAVGGMDELLLIAATSMPQKSGSWQALKIPIPRLRASFTGTGDLLAALLLARLDQMPDDLKTAVELALAGLQHVVYETYKFSTKHLSSEEATEVMKMKELQLIPNQHLLLNPKVKLRAVQLKSPAERNTLG